MPSPVAPFSDDRLARNTWRIALVLAILMGLITGLATLLPNAFIFQSGFVTLLASLALALIWGRRPRWGAWVLIVGFALLGLLGPLFQRDIGLLSALTVVIASNAIGLLTLPGPHAGALLLPTFGVACLVLVVDVFAPATRPAPAYPAIRAVLTVGITAIYIGVIIQQFRAFPLFNKLLLSMLLSAVLAVGSVVAVTLQVTQQQVFNHQGQNLRQLAQHQSLALSARLAEQINVLRGGLTLSQLVQETLQTSNQAYLPDPAVLLETQAAQWQPTDPTAPLVQERLNNALARELYELRQAYPGYRTLALVDRYGGLQAAQHALPSYSQAAHRWWQAAVQGQVYLGAPANFPQYQSDGMEIALPVYARAQPEVIGVLYAVIDLQTLSAAFLNHSDAHSPKPYQITLYFPLDQEELSPAGTLQMVTTNLLALQQLAEPNAPAFVVGADQALYSAAPLDLSALTKSGLAADWRVIARQDLAAVLAPIQEATRAATLTTIVVLLATALMISLLSRWLVRPLRELTQVARRVRTGDLAAQAPLRAPDEVGLLAQAFNAMTAQLRANLTDTEQVAAERTRTLNNVALISAQLASIADEERLAAAAAQQIRAIFNYEAVFVFWLTPDGQTLQLIAGTGAAQTLLTEHYEQRVGEGLIGLAALHNRPCFAPDTWQSPDFIPHAQVPKTRAEIAVPIALGERVLGVLDIQQNTPHSLTAADVDVMKTIASLLAVSAQNARQLAQARAKAQHEAEARALTQKIQNTSTVKAALQVAVRELGRLTSQTPYVKLRPPEED
jgi:putative methionine-R-sulfoxide reductase with GAF domain